jgi:hypothetical protein
MMHMPVQRRRQTNGQIFAIPMVIGILSVIGLLSALIGDGVWDAVSWLTLGIPIVLCVYFFVRRRRV